MNDKRDEVIEAAKTFFKDFLIVQKMDAAEAEEITTIGGRFALSREAELHDEITQLKADLAIAKQAIKVGQDLLNIPVRNMVSGLLTEIYGVHDSKEYLRRFREFDEWVKQKSDLAQQTLDKIGKE